MSGKLHLICMTTEGLHAKITCNFNDIWLPESGQKKQNPAS